MLNMRLLIALFILFSWRNASTQPGFNLSYDLGQVGAAFENILLHKDTLVMHGTIFSEAPPYKSGGMIAWADTNGNILKSRFYFDSTGRDFLYFYGEPFIRLKDGSGYLISVNVRKNGALMKVNPDGDLVSLAEYVDNTSITDFYRQIIEVDDGFYVTGFKQRLDYLMDGFVMKLDKNGKKRWEKYFDAPGRNAGIGSFYMRSSNEFAITTGSSPNNAQVPINQRYYTNDFFLTDSLMNVKKQWKSPVGLEFGSQGLKKISDQTWGHLSSDIILFPNDDNWTRQSKYVIRDEDFNRVKEVKLGTSSSRVNVLYNLNLCPDGNYVAAGEIFVDGDRPATAGWIYKITPEGDSIWSVVDTLFYIQGGFVEHSLPSVVVLPSGSIIACGIVDAYKGNFGKSWAWLLKVSKDGCIEASNCVPVSAVEVPVEKEVGIKAYPNPAHKNATFELNFPAGLSADLHVFDTNGRLASSFTSLIAGASVVWDTHSVISGLYYYRVVSSGAVIASGKVVVNH